MEIKQTELEKKIEDSMKSYNFACRQKEIELKKRMELYPKFIKGIAYFSVILTVGIGLGYSISEKKPEFLYNLFDTPTATQAIISPPIQDNQIIPTTSPEIYPTASGLTSTYDYNITGNIIDYSITESSPSIQDTPQPTNNNIEQFSSNYATIPKDIVDSLAIYGLTSEKNVQSCVDTAHEGRSYITVFPNQIVPAQVLFATNFDEAGKSWTEYPVIPICYSGSWGLFKSTQEFIAPYNGAYWTIK